MRADCRFAHDLKQITCKYWIDGECLKGENCEFLHEMLEETTPQPLSSKAAKKAQKALVVKKKDFKLDTEEFPALGGGPAPCVPKPVEFPPLGSSPVSVPAEVVSKPESTSQTAGKKITLTADVPVFVSKTTSPLWTVDANNSSSKVKTAASVLKNNAVNLVPNKAQQSVQSNTQSLANKIKQKAADPSPNTPKDQRKSRDSTDRKSQPQVKVGNSSCGSSSQSSSCSSLSGTSRGSSVVRQSATKK